jgi:hypothetical protein
LLEAEPRQYVIGWDVTRLAVRGDNMTVLEAVVQAATAHLQSRGVPRLFARCREDASAALKSLEFHSLACEHILLGPKADAAQDVPLPVDSRYRMPSDAWPLHQLELETTPALVRQLEGLTSLDWSKRIRERAEIVVERDGRIVAWIGWGAKVRPGLLQLGLLVHPRHTELAPDLLNHALKTLESDCRFVARVRSYHPEVLQTLLDAEFRVVREETLMVKHAAVQLARAATGRMRVAGVPGIQALRIRLGPGGLAPVPRPTPKDL